MLLGVLATSCMPQPLPGEGTSALSPLPPCSAQDTAYAKLPFDSWDEEYHDAVRTLVDERLAELRAGTQVKSCEVASEEAPLGARLVELLDKYECALKEHGRNVAQEINTEASGEKKCEEDGVCARDESIDSCPADCADTETRRDYEKNWEEWRTYYGLSEEESRRTQIIEDELRTARPTLDRLLLFLGHLNRFRPVAVALQCLQRASLDLRNSLGLASSALSCSERARDVRTSLRDKHPGVVADDDAAPVPVAP